MSRKLIKTSVTILVVEDERSLRVALRDKLASEGFTVLEAKNGEEGLAMSMAEHPDLVLLDIVMPKMEGMTMLRELRKDREWGEHVPVIILTNLVEDDRRALDVMKTEPAYYLVKNNMTLQDVVEKIKQRLADSHPHDN